MTPSLVHMGRLALPWIVAVVAMIYITRQCRRPSGPVGWMFAQLMNRSHGGLTAWALSHVPVSDDAMILDVGCGGGKTIDRLASLAPRGRVSGVDYSTTSVATARRTNSVSIAAGRVDVQEASVSQLPFEANSFDVVTAMETHYYWSDLVRDLGEIRRVLKPGGRLMIGAESYDRGGTSVVDKPVMAMLGAKFLSRDEHCRLFEAAGFTDVRAYEEKPKGWLCVVGTKGADSAGV